MCDYIPNAGQTALPIRDNVHVPLPEFTPAPRPDPLLPEPLMNPDARARGLVAGQWCQHFLPGVTAGMMDWWWANMEKGYYLWAPGAHKRFSWVKAPAQVGFAASAHCISEAMVAGKPVFGGDGVVIQRLDLRWYPFATGLSHIIVEGVFNDGGEFCDSTVHMWEDVPGGVNHMTVSVVNSRCSAPPAFVQKCPQANPTDQERALHAEYEASRWPVFLPKLYALWEGHPDPSQNVACDLTVAWQGGRPVYLAKNGPVTP